MFEKLIFKFSQNLLVNARDRIIEYLISKKSDGVMQRDIHSSLNLSKSTVSEILKELESKGEIVREKIGRSCRVWHSDFAPFPTGKVRVGLLKATEYPHVILAARKLGLRIILFDDALSLTRALTTGSLDIGISPLITQVMFGLLLKSIKIHAIVAYNGSGVVSSKKIEDGMSFGTTELSTMESNLRLFTERTGTQIGRISYFDSVERMIESYRKAEFDALAIWEPYFSKLNGYKYEFRDVIGDFPCCSMASSLPFYTSKRELLVKFRKEMEKAIGRMNKKEMISVLSFMGFNEREIENSLKSYRFLAEINEKDVKFLENYGIKLISENVSNLIDKLEF
ncbi:MAG TPA: hypothetical protein EYP30_06360 [Archaeoglobaceae archaeon]|nr:hypothetical protein [Archaeoglobaceae archaeon]